MIEMDLIRKIHSRADETCYASILRSWDKDEAPFSPDSWAKKEAIYKLKARGLSFAAIAGKLGLGLTVIQEHIREYERVMRRKYMPETISQEMYDRMYPTSDFYIKSEALINEGATDTYFSINSFWQKNKANIDVRHLNCFALDFDYYKIKKYESYPPLLFYNQIIKNKLPLAPTAVVNSGRGIYVLYCFKDCSYHMATLYKAIYKALYEKFKVYGMDGAATNITQVIRLPGTINSKSLTTVSIIETLDTSYRIQDFTGLLNHSEQAVKDYKSTIQIRKIKGSNENKYEFDYAKRKLRDPIYQQLLDDFKKLIVLRNRDHNYTGYREMLLYIVREYGTWSGLSIKDSVAAALEINELFHEPLTQKVIETQCKPSNNRRKCSYETIIRKLNISVMEQKQLKLLKSKGLKKSLYASRKRKHKLLNISGKQEARFKRMASVMALKLQGFSNRAIADKLEINKSTVGRDLAYIKDHPAQCKNRIEKYMQQMECKRETDIYKRNTIYDEQKQLSEWLNNGHTALDYLVRQLGVAEN
ncbi:hypothetical protein [Anaerorhabdus sp.]|uniref:hypothetical protein n=1 Tax=Anaerorhabdus sp. TaxID=1872524 RepID=UPI002FC61D60